jgi:hypothetical protein
MSAALSGIRIIEIMERQEVVRLIDAAAPALRL